MGRIRGGEDMEVSERLCPELQPDLRRASLQDYRAASGRCLRGLVFEKAGKGLSPDREQCGQKAGVDHQ